MPIVDNPDPNHAMKKIAVYRALGPGARRRRILCLDQRAAELEIAENAGSARDLRAVSCGAVVEWFGKRQTERGYRDFKHNNAWLERLFVGPMAGRAFSSLTLDQCNDIIDAMVEEGARATTMRSRRYLLQNLCNRAQLRGFHDSNPMRLANRSMPRVADTDHELVSEEEIASLRPYASPKSGAVLDLACEGGVELTLMGRLQWADVDFRAGSIKLPGTPVPGDREGESSSRPVPMSARLAASLLRWRLHSGRRSGLMFPTRDGAPGYPQMFLVMLEELQNAAGLLAPDTPVAPRAPRSQGTSPRKKQPGRPYRLERGRYTWTPFRNAAGVRWAQEEGLKVVSERLGISVTTAQARYQSVYDRRLSEQIVMTLSFGGDDV